MDSKFEIIRRGVRWAIYDSDGHKVYSHWDRNLVDRQKARLEEKEKATEKAV